MAADVDRAARETLRIQGYAEYFTHRLGHGRLVHLDYITA